MAIAVPNLEEAMALYQSLLGKGAEHIEECPIKGARRFRGGRNEFGTFIPDLSRQPHLNFLQKNPEEDCTTFVFPLITLRLTGALKKQGVKLIDEKPASGPTEN